MLLVQLSDPHIVEEGELLLGGIDTATFLREAVEHVNRPRPASPTSCSSPATSSTRVAPRQYDHLRQLLEPLRAPYHLVPGNHDLTDELRAAFPDHVHGDRRPRRWRHRGAAADRHARQLPVPGARRLPRCRAARVARPDPRGRRPTHPTIVAVHHPPFATGIQHMDTMALDAASAAGTGGGGRGPPAGGAGPLRAPAPLHQPPLRGHDRDDRRRAPPTPCSSTSATAEQHGTTSRRRSSCTSGRPPEAWSPTSR